MSRPLLREAGAEARFGGGPGRAERYDLLFSFPLSTARFAHGPCLQTRTLAGIRRSATTRDEASGSTGGCRTVHRLRRLSRCVPSERHFPVGSRAGGFHKMCRVWSLCEPLSCGRHFPGRRNGGRNNRLCGAFSPRDKITGRKIGWLCGGAGGVKRPAGEAPAARPLHQGKATVVQRKRFP